MREYSEISLVCQRDRCGKQFVATRKDAKFCSSRCRVANCRENSKPGLLVAMVAKKDYSLIEGWNVTRQLSDYAEQLILEIFGRYGYEAARLAIAACNAQYGNVAVRTEAMDIADEDADASVPEQDFWSSADDVG